MDYDWVRSYNARYDRLMTIKGMLEDWMPKTEAEEKCIKAIIAKIEKYADYLDEE